MRRARSRYGTALNARSQQPNPAPLQHGPRTLRIASLDAIRAFASVTIVWNHCFTANQNLQFENPALAGVVAFPSVFLGQFVLLFFVISGGVHFFLVKGRTGRPVQKGFLERNLLRLCLPAITALLLATTHYAVSYFVKGFGHMPTVRELISNVLFVAHFTGENWTNVVLWNISVQLQHILWIALVVIPLLRFRNGPLIAATSMLALSGVVSVVPIGLVLVNDWPVFRHPAVRWHGGISFSLYLVHVPIGQRVINLGADWASNDLAGVCVYAVSFAAIFAAAIAFHRWIEEPCTRCARRVFS